MMIKDSLFLLFSNVLGRGCWARRGPTNYNKGFFVSTYFRNQIVSVGGTVDYFKTLWDLIFRKSFFIPTVLKLMTYSLGGGLQGIA